jgi:hypothetical protein
MTYAMSIVGGLPEPEEVKKHDTSKLAMLVGIYLPTAQPALEAMESAFGAHGTTMAELMLKREPGPLKAAFESGSTFQSKAVALQKLVAEAARATI